MQQPIKFFYMIWAFVYYRSLSKYCKTELEIVVSFVSSNLCHPEKKPCMHNYVESF